MSHILSYNGFLSVVKETSLADNIDGKELEHRMVIMSHGLVEESVAMIVILKTIIKNLNVSSKISLENAKKELKRCVYM